DAVRNHDAGEAGAKTEGGWPQKSNMVADGNVGQIEAPGERGIADVRDAVRDHDAGQPGVVKGIVADAGNTDGNRHVRQTDIVREGSHAERSDAIRNRNFGQGSHISERVVPDRGDRQANDGAGDGDLTPGPAVSSDRYRPVRDQIGKNVTT